MVCPHCSERIDPFGHGGGKRTAEAMGLHFMGELPLEARVRVGGDTGRPVSVAGSPEFEAIAHDLIACADQARANPTFAANPYFCPKPTSSAS